MLKKRERFGLALALSTAGLVGWAGCGGGEGSSPNPESGVQGSGAGPCMVGNWTVKQTEMSSGGTVTAQGGAGVQVRVQDTGNLTVTFDGMAPVTFEASGLDSPMGGSFTYTGTMSAQLAIPAIGQTSGDWVTTSADYGDVYFVMKITEPFELEMDPMSLADAAAMGTAMAEGSPLGSGTWTCSGNTLTIVGVTDSTTTTWTMQRS